MKYQNANLYITWNILSERIFVRLQATNVIGLLSIAKSILNTIFLAVCFVSFDKNTAFFAVLMHWGKKKKESRISSILIVIFMSKNGNMYKIQVKIKKNLEIDVV